MNQQTTDYEAELKRLRNALDGFSSGRTYRKLAADVEKWRTECWEARRCASAAEAAIERYQALLDKMRHGEEPFGGSAADSADILDAALDTPSTPESPREHPIGAVCKCPPLPYPFICPGEAQEG